MIKLRVTSFNGSPPQQELSCIFDPSGGTIGRAETNKLPLPDPERSVSRLHAQIVFRGGGFVIVDVGSNPISVNGRPLGNGTESPLRVGDEVHIGGYSLMVDPGDGSSAVPAPAFGSSAPSPFDSPPAAATPAAAWPALASSADDPFGFGTTQGPGGSASADPFADLGFSSSPAAAAPAPAPRPGLPPPPPPPPKPASTGIPDDWDPFSDMSPAPAAAKSSSPFGGSSSGSGGSNSDPFADFGFSSSDKAAAPLASGGGSMGLHTRKESSIDDLFGIDSGAAPFDPLASAAPPPSTPSPSSRPKKRDPETDDFMAMFDAPAPPPSSQISAIGDLNAPFVAPRQMAAAPLPAAAAGGGAVLSFGDDSANAGKTMIRPVARARAAKPQPAPLSQPGAFDPPPMAPALRQTGVAPASPSAPASAGLVNEQALIAAFREGLGLPDLPLQSLTPGMMKLIGQMMRESTRGTVELLSARAALKREIRAEVTTIVARENNPLKFSPNADTALRHLFGPPTQGYMPAQAAMRDAYDDLRAHQFGMMAGLRAALDGVLQRFDPGVLEGRLTQKSMLASLLPSSRKARLWELFNELYAQLSAEAADDFHQLFGKAFLKAYEAHVDELHKGRS
jgi:FHA domain-containing protein